MQSGEWLNCISYVTYGRARIEDEAKAAGIYFYELKFEATDPNFMHVNLSPAQFYLKINLVAFCQRLLMLCPCYIMAVVMVK